MLKNRIKSQSYAGAEFNLFILPDDSFLSFELSQASTSWLKYIASFFAIRLCLASRSIRIPDWIDWIGCEFIWSIIKPQLSPAYKFNLLIITPSASVMSFIEITFAEYIRKRINAEIEIISGDRWDTNFHRKLNYWRFFKIITPVSQHGFHFTISLKWKYYLWIWTHRTNVHLKTQSRVFSMRLPTVTCLRMLSTPAVGVQFIQHREQIVRIDGAKFYFYQWSKPFIPFLMLNKSISNEAKIYFLVRNEYS